MMKLPTTFAANAIVFILLSIASFPCVAEEPNAAPILGIEPDAKIQAKLDKLISQAIAKDDDSADNTSKLAWMELVNFVRRDREGKVLRQLVYRSGDPSKPGHGLEPITLALVCDASGTISTNALLPILDYVLDGNENPQSRYQALMADERTNSAYENSMMLAYHVERPIEVKQVIIRSLGNYIPHIPKELNDESKAGLGLVSYLFLVEPGQALHEIAKQQLGYDQAVQEFLEAEHAISDYLFWREWKRRFPERAVATDAIRADLARYAEDDRWWVRLYAVQIYNRAPELADGSTLELLSKDPHPRVQSALDAETLQNQ